MPTYLLSTLNEDGTTNISPMSSSWDLGNYIILGVGLGGKSIENLERYRECVMNLSSSLQWAQVEKITPYTGEEKVIELKYFERIDFKQLIDWIDSEKLITLG